MLREFIDSQHRSIPQDEGEFVRQTTNAFDKCVDFLRDTKRFPNKEINQLTGLMWNLIRNRNIPIVLDLSGRIPDFIFMVTEEGLKVRPLYVLPKKFLSSINSEAVQQLGVIVYMASQGRDFYLNKVRKGTSQEINTRAQGYEAEALITLQKMCEGEDLTVSWWPFQQGILERFPNGLKSMPQGLAYQTPIYMRARRQG